jgi:hypothetical protein
METIASKDRRAHTANVRKEFGELIEHLRGDINKIDEPKAQALFETAAEASMAAVCWEPGVSAAGYSEPEENGPRGRGYS